MAAFTTKHLLRNRLRLTTYKRHGNFVLPMTQAGHLRVLAERYGIEDKDSGVSGDRDGAMR